MIFPCQNSGPPNNGELKRHSGGMDTPVSEILELSDIQIYICPTIFIFYFGNPGALHGRLAILFVVFGRFV